MEIYFARGEKSSDFASKDYIHINNFGYYKNILKTVCTARINGRCDYQIILCVTREDECENKR